MLRRMRRRRNKCSVLLIFVYFKATEAFKCAEFVFIRERVRNKKNKK